MRVPISDRTPSWLASWNKKVASGSTQTFRTELHGASRGADARDDREPRAVIRLLHARGIIEDVTAPVVGAIGERIGIRDEAARRVAPMGMGHGIAGDMVPIEPGKRTGGGRGGCAECERGK